MVLLSCRSMRVSDTALLCRWYTCKLLSTSIQGQAISADPRKLHMPGLEEQGHLSPAKPRAMHKSGSAWETG